MSINYSRGYTVLSELEFLGGLGSFARPGHSRAGLLRGYLIGLDKRHAGFSANEVNALRTRAHELLERERRR